VIIAFQTFCKQWLCFVVDKDLARTLTSMLSIKTFILKLELPHKGNGIECS
jgi:hypothetical protein